MKDGQYSHCPKPLPSYCHIVFSMCLSFSRLSQWKQRICHCNHNVPREGWKMGKGGRTDSVHLVTKLLPLQIFSWSLYQINDSCLHISHFYLPGRLGIAGLWFCFLFLEQGTLLPFPISTIHGNVTNEEREDKY